MRAQRVIGVDLGGTKIASGVVTQEGAIERRAVRPTPVDSTAAVLAALEESVSDVLDDSIAALGFGLPSTIDQRTGRAVFSANIPLADIDLRTHMAERFGLPVGIDNDANAAAIAEWVLGAGRGSRHMVMLTLGTGIGGGLILDGRPYRGAVGSGAELGHMVIVHDGPRCQGACTGHGHLETLASGRAASLAAHEAFGADVDARALVGLAQAGDVRAREILEFIGRRLGSGIATLVNIFNPELVVLGGGFAAAGNLLVDPAREVVALNALSPARELVRIVPAQLGGEAGLVGAGLVALEVLDPAATPA